MTLGERTILVFDTSTESMVLGLQTRDHFYELTAPGGARASEQLIPSIQLLMAQAQLAFKDLEGIGFGAGPGAFTGLRTSCAVAQGLGFAAQVPLLPINTLHAVALARFWAAPSPSASAVMGALDARMGEVYWQHFDFSHELLGLEATPPQLSRQDDLPDGMTHWPLGTLPTAHSLLALAGSMLSKQGGIRAAEAVPVYVRNKVAQTTEERQAKLTAATAAASEVKTWQCEADGAVVARLELLRGVEEAEILQLETHPHYRRRGLARQLLVQALAWAQSQQRRAIWLEVRPSNAPALGLYQQMGFERVRTRRRYYADGEDALVMKCTVPSQPKVQPGRDVT